MDQPRAVTRPPATAPVPEGRTWGIDPVRRNRLTVRAVLALVRAPSARTRVGRRLRRGALAAGSQVLGCDLQPRAIGEGLFLPHPFGIVIHGRSTIGDRCTIYQHVTIGEDNVRPGVPLIGDDVVIGAGAAILGPVRVGDGARIGANAVVLSDVPGGAAAVGVPARVVGRA